MDIGAQPVPGTGLLACIGPVSDAERLIASAARLARQAGTPWHAIYVETPRLQRLPSSQRQRILEQLKHAQAMGATTAVLAGSDIATMVADYARSQGLATVVIGRSHRNFHWPWRTEVAAQIAVHAPEVDLVVVASDNPAPQENEPFGQRAMNLGLASRRKQFLIGGGASLLTALATLPLLPYFDMANIAMLFVLTVVLVAVRLGREASVVATVVGVVAFVLLTPRIAFGASDLQYTVTFMVMLVVGLITGGMTADLRYQARIAIHRESRSRALYEFARALSGALQTEQVFDITRAFIQRTFNAHATLLLPDQQGRLSYPELPGRGESPVMSVLDMGLALVAPMRTRGVLVIWSENARWMLIPEQRKQLDTFGALAAIALERVHYVEVAQEALVSMESERLRNSLLAALSHDLRTPLTSLVGLSESLAISRPALTPAQHDLALSLRDEAVRMSTLVANLLEMARIQSGHVQLNLQWQAIEEVVGSALRASHLQLTRHQVKTALERDLPLVRFDAVLIERVLCNLMENASKYTAPGSCITIGAAVQGDHLTVTVSDNGPGLPAGREEALFEKFTRGERESPIPGVGLGLAICRAIVQAHGGTIRASQSADGGAAFAFTLPLGTPPDLSFIDENESEGRPGAPVNTP